MKKFLINKIPLLIRIINQLRCHEIYKKNIKKSSFVDKTARLIGLKDIIIGENSIISENTWLNVNNRGNLGIIIGNNCFIGKNNFFSSGKEIVISDYCMFGLDCRFLGSNHLFDNPFMPYISTGTTNEGIIKVGVNCWLGTGVTVIGDVRIGYGSIIGANSLVNKDIPPFSVVVGNPGRVIKRYDVILEKWIKISECNEGNEKHLPTEEEYLQILKSKKPLINKPYYAATKAFGNLL